MIQVERVVDHWAVREDGRVLCISASRERALGFAQEVAARTGASVEVNGPRPEAGVSE